MPSGNVTVALFGIGIYVEMVFIVGGDDMHEIAKGHDWRNYKTCNCREPGCWSYRRNSVEWELTVFDNAGTIVKAISIYRGALEKIVRKTYSMRKRSKEEAGLGRDVAYNWDNGAPISGRIYATIKLKDWVWEE